MNTPISIPEQIKQFEKRLREVREAARAANERGDFRTVAKLGVETAHINLELEKLRECIEDRCHDFRFSHYS